MTAGVVNREIPKGDWTGVADGPTAVVMILIVFASLAEEVRPVGVRIWCATARTHCTGADRG